MAQKLDDLALLEHPVDPDEAGPEPPHLLHPAPDLGGDLGRVGRSGAQDQLGVRVDHRRRVEQMDDPLLPGDPADEHHRGRVRIDTVPLQDVGSGVRPILKELSS